MRLPTLFLSHGSPMYSIEPGAAGRAWAALGDTLGKPAAVLIASAHWDTDLPMVTGNPKPETIHDFGGFPRAFYDLRYPAPGAPDVAARAVALLKRAGITAGIDGCRGLDHGAWVPLRWMYPDADVPVVQLAVQPGRGTAHHVELGRALASLAEENVLIIGSGHTTHNLRDWMSNRQRTEPQAYAREFAQWLARALAAGDTDALVHYRDVAPGAARAHPSEEHFLPLHVAWGAAGEGARAEQVLDGLDTGVLSMDSYLFHPAQAEAAHAAVATATAPH